MLKNILKLKRRDGGCLMNSVIIMVAVIILAFVALPKLVGSLTNEQFPLTSGGYLTYDYYLGTRNDPVKVEFSPLLSKKIDLKIISRTNTETRSINAVSKFEDEMRALQLNGMAPVWYPIKRLARGGRVQGYRITEEMNWKGWDVWVAGEHPYNAMYYERNTGFLVGFGFSTPTVPESTIAILADHNIAGLKKAQ